MNDLTENQLSSDQVFHGKLLDVRLDHVRLPDGSEGIREYIVHPGAVLIIPVLPDGTLLFERQYRYPVARTMLELPAGKIDPGEGILETAVRELREETGHSAGYWQHLGTMHPCIGYSDERIEIFLAKDLQRIGEQALDPGEFLDLLTMTPKAAYEAVLSGDITDGKTITALFWFDQLARKSS